MESDIIMANQWVGNHVMRQDELRQAWRLGLETLPRPAPPQDNTTQVMQALLQTGKIQHPAVPHSITEDAVPRQTPPILPGTPVSKILIAQRRGELGPPPMLTAPHGSKFP